jgi:hypothetical protein
MRFERVKQDDIYFKKCLGDDFKYSKYAIPENLRKTRNVAIVLSFVEIVCSILAIAFYIRRRSRIILIIIVLTFISSLFGLWAKIRLNFWGIVIHAGFTIAIIGGFCIYIVVDAAFGTDSNQKTGGMNEYLVLFLLSIPLLIILACGIYSLCLMFILDEEIEERKKAEGEREFYFPDSLDDDYHTIEVL